MIELNNVYKEYENFSLEVNNLSFSLPSLTTVTGENGSGKTTLLKIMAGVNSFDQKGIVEINGINIKSSDKWKDSISSFLGDEYLLEFLTKDEYLSFHLSSYQKDYRVCLSRSTLFEDIYNSIPSGKLIREFSKGNKAKLGILATILADTLIMIFDEPFANLDKETQESLANIIGNLKSDKVIILSTHHEKVISSHTDKWIKIKDGCIG